MKSPPLFDSCGGELRREVSAHGRYISAAILRENRHDYQHFSAVLA
jgi:hypothetical protein